MGEQIAHLQRASEVPRRALDTKKAAHYLDVSLQYLKKLRAVGGGPRYARIGHRVLYPITELDAWLESRLVGSTSEEEIMS